jgi:cell division transport system permease protein
MQNTALRSQIVANVSSHHHIVSFLRIVKTGLQNFVRNAWLSIAAIAMMIITLGIILFSFIASATFNHTIEQITDKIDISVYLKDSVDEAQRNALISKLKGVENVKSIEYVSKDEALEEYKKANEDNVDLLLAISQTDNPLPASLRIKPIDVNRIEEIKAFIENPEIKKFQSDETSYSGDRKEAIDKITGATRFFQRAGFVAVIVFAIISMLIIFNTIQMAIFNRRDELQIMRLLGASTWYIRGPFIVETVFYGIISAGISVSIGNSLFLVASKTFDASSLGLLDIEFANRYFAQNFWAILTLQLAVGIVIGAVSSYIATARYLKFKTSK